MRVELPKPNPMNGRVKKMWLEALRNGEYKKNTGSLRKDDCFCVQGVLCDLYAKAKKIDWVLIIGTSGKHSILGERDRAPQAVLEWAGIEKGTNEAKIFEHVMWMNDQPGVDFKNIADVIEKEL